MKTTHLTLKQKLVLSFSLATFFGFSALGIANYFFAQKLLKQGILEKLQAQIDGIETTIKLSFEENLQRSEALMDHWGKEVLPKMKVDTGNITAIDVENQVTHEKVKVKVPRLLYEGKALEENQVVDRLAEVTDDSVTFFVKTSEGYVRVSTNVVRADGSRNVNTLIPLDSPVSKKMDAGHRYVGRAYAGGKWWMAAYQPLIQDGQVVGAFFLGTPENSSAKIRDFLKTQKIFRTGYYFIMNKESQMLLHPSKEGKNMASETDLDGRPIFKEILEQKNGILEYRWLNAETQKSQQKMAAFKYIPEMDWYVAASFNKAEAEEVLGTLKTTSLIITLIGVLAMIALSFVYGHGISKSLQLLSDRLLEITQQTTRESEELSGSSQSLSSSATEAAASLEETAASLEEINSQVKNNLKMTEETNQLGKSSLKSAQVSESKLKNLNQFMLEILEDSKKVQEISSLIDDIAFQTNLLSLNAAVEAARAGEHGKGFAVVADAVRSLAAKSAESARQITSTINESSERVQKVVSASEEVNQSFQEIVSNIEKFSTLLSEITISSEEQASGISQINQAMNQLDLTTQNNSQLAESISAASNELSEHSLQLESAVQDLNSLLKGGKAEIPNAEGLKNVLPFRRAA